MGDVNSYTGNLGKQVVVLDTGWWVGVKVAGIARRATMLVVLTTGGIKRLAAAIRTWIV